VPRSRTALTTFVVAVVAMVATPLFPKSGDERLFLAHIVVVALCASAVSAAMTSVGAFRAAIASLAVAAFTFVVELVGHTTGVPFGEYDYADRLWPQVAGVPVIVPLAWVAITWCSWAVGSRVTTSLPLRIAVIAWSITAWDLFLDPQMVGEGYWTWQPAAPAYRGIPLTNFLGWFATGIVAAGIVLVATWRHFERSRFGSTLLVVIYTVLWILSTVGFAVFFDDPFVALVGGVGMGVPALVSWRPRRREPVP
jgi:putative membrane protein